MTTKSQPVAGAGSLDRIGPAHPVRVVGIHGTGRIIRRLAVLGMVPGSIVTVVRARQPVLVSIGGTLLALDHHTARSILVEDIG